MLKNLCRTIKASYTPAERVKNIHFSFGVKLRECIVCTFAYIICIKRKRRRADVEDPEEARDKELEIRLESRPPPALPKTNSVLLLAVPLPALPLSPPSFPTSPYNGAFTHLYTHRLATRAQCMGPRVPTVLRYSCVLRSFGRGTRHVYASIRYLRYIYIQDADMYSQASDARCPHRFGFDTGTWQYVGADRRHACTGKSSHVTHIHTPRNLSIAVTSKYSGTVRAPDSLRPMRLLYDASVFFAFKRASRHPQGYEILTCV